ncbi:hypothetical protein BRC81_10940 [Halobacteriales archaeon QS_1_68_20]|nr:MAG: hypothetical protein BRC81_10940 [Halobacteriales archaeon QS_1_68_20]
MPEVREQCGESCPWCGTGLDDDRDLVVVSPRRRQAPDQLLHRDCANEWEAFVERARSVAARGARHPLLDAPLERGFEIRRRGGDRSR